MNVQRQHESRRRNGPSELFVISSGITRHQCTGLGQEILDDDFLDMPISAMHLGDRFQGVAAILPRFADTNQEPRREGDIRFSGGSQRFQAASRSFVGRETVSLEVGR